MYTYIGSNICPGRAGKWDEACGEEGREEEGKRGGEGGRKKRTKGNREPRREGARETQEEGSEGENKRERYREGHFLLGSGMSRKRHFEVPRAAQRSAIVTSTFGEAMAGGFATFGLPALRLPIALAITRR